MITILFLYNSGQYEMFQGDPHNLKDQVKYWIRKRKDYHTIRTILTLGTCCSKSQMRFYDEVLEEENKYLEAMAEAKEREEYLRLKEKYEPFPA